MGLIIYEAFSTEKNKSPVQRDTQVLGRWGGVYPDGNRPRGSKKKNYPFFLRFIWRQTH